MKKHSLFLLALLVLTACSGLPGGISVTYSKFDASRIVRLEPGWVGEGNIKLGLYQSSKMTKDEVILTAMAIWIFNIADKESLQFNIDGEFLVLTPIDSYTYFSLTEGYTSWSSRKYLINKLTIKRLLNAQRVIVRIVSDRNTFVEGNFSINDPQTAYRGFYEFYHKI
jgi:hypothetical protein